MNPEEEILDAIAGAVDSYASVDLSDRHAINEMLRVINANIFFLTQYKVEARNRWHSVYKNSAGKSEAAKTREADGTILELKYYRDIIRVAESISKALISHLSLAKHEGN